MCAIMLPPQVAREIAGVRISERLQNEWGRDHHE